jgi:LysM repeat protein
MKLHYNVLTVIFILLSICLFAQNKSLENNKQPKFPDSLYIIISGDQFILQYKIRKGETLFSLCKQFNIDKKKIFKLNPKLEQEGLKTNELLNLPLPKKLLVKKKEKSFKESNYSKVYYKVEPKETLYKVAVSYFNLDVETVQKRNNLKTNDLKVGQFLHIGWFSKSGFPDSLKQKNWLSADLSKENQKNQKKYNSETNTNKNEQVQEGKVCWVKHQKTTNSKNLYILYDAVDEGTIVEVNNPMTQRKVYAKVIGKVPKTSFAEGSIAMLSPALAESLGILDSYSFLIIKSKNNK